jgi:hypothetical protein
MNQHTTAIEKPPKPPPCSWWTLVAREGFTKYVIEHQMPRMQPTWTPPPDGPKPTSDRVAVLHGTLEGE